MEDARANPDVILQKIKNEESQEAAGKLKIFFGYAAGVGKTYTMLEDAHDAKGQGVDVVIGYIEPHARPETMALTEGLEMLPLREAKHGGITLREFDLDAALKRKPELILVDELAHTNGDGSRHAKRYQDIEELLKAGIDVFTTVNVQHVESLNDMVSAITGVVVQERVPDKVFDNAYQVELIDLEPEDLIGRLHKGKVYKKNQAERALENFFNVENLVSLREIALRRCADRINKLTDVQRAGRERHYTEEHILACISPSPANSKIIRTAARMAAAFKGAFTALYIETPDYQSFSEEDKNRVRKNMRLARQLGATVETAYGDDVAFQISEFARLSGVSKIVMGRSTGKKRWIFRKPSLTERVTNLTLNIDIYIIPEKNTPYYQRRRRKEPFKFLPADLLKTAGIMAAATAIGAVFYHFGFSESNIITIYILGVLVTSVITTNRYYSLAAAFINVLIFNFLFTEPRFTFLANDAGYPITFAVMFTAAFLTSSLAIRIKRQARQAAETAYRTKILFDTNQLIGIENDERGIVSVSCRQLSKLLQRDILFYGAKDGGLASPLFFPGKETANRGKYDSDYEFAVASWVYNNNEHAGATTDTLGDAACLYFSVRVGKEVYGVVGIAIYNKEPLDSFEQSIMMSILGEFALALKNQKVSREHEETTLLAKNEQLRANLLRSISHDLRTPLTSISGNAGILFSEEDRISREKRKALYKHIYDDSIWLINMVENLLSVTRIQDGTMKLSATPELISEVVEEALRHIGKDGGDHRIVQKPAEEFILASMDARLIMQVVVNIVENGVKYTPPGSEIVIETQREDGMAVVRISDNGNGIREEDKAHIFDMFFTTDKKSPDSRRSLGMGLALCKSIINAHGGDIYLKDNVPKGTVFTFTLPAKEVALHE